MRRRENKEVPIEQFYALRPAAYWNQLKREHVSFWMLCAYLFVEYVRPQSIVPQLDVLPWAQTFLLLAIGMSFLDRKLRWVHDRASVFLLLFLLVIILASTFAEFPSISWDHFKDFFGWVIVYFLVINIVNTERRLLIFLAIFVLASFKLSFFGARLWAGRGFAFTDWGIMGPPGFFQNSGELAVQMLMFAPIVFCLALFMRPYVGRIKYFILLFIPVTAAMTVLGASSRGGQLGLAYQVYRVLLKTRLALRTLLLAVALGAVVWQLLPDEQKQRFTSIGEDRSSRQRLLYWEHGLEMIKEHPVLGVGYFNFPAFYERHYPQDMLYPHAELPHNIFIQVGTDAGLLGLLCFALLLHRNVQCAKEVIRRCETEKAKPYAPLARGLLVAFWGFLIAGQFVTITYYPFFWMNLALTVALRNVACGEGPALPRRSYVSFP